MEEHNNGFIKYSERESLLPQEEILDFESSKSSLTIAVPAETSFQECRIPLAPQAVGLLVGIGRNGFGGLQANQSHWCRKCN